MEEIKGADTIDEKEEILEPKKYAVVIHNDNYTAFDFVMELLTGVFKHDYSKAWAITKQVHDTGSGVAGIYPFEIAETKMAIASRISKENEYPLRITCELA